MKFKLMFFILFLGSGLTAQIFSELTINNLLEGVKNSSVAFEDIDNDGDEDVLITGRTNQSYSTLLYLNNGLGNFTEMENTPFEDVAYGAIAFADVDGDNDPDVLITGQTGAQVISELFLNDGLGNFTKKMDTPFIGMYFGAITFADLDGDNDQDLMITGRKNYMDDALINIYFNDGNGNFDQATSNDPFIAIKNGAIGTSDIDNDGDQDVLITGEYDNNLFAAFLYLNDGLGNFTKILDPPFLAVRYGSIAFIDLDNDNDLDVLVSGSGPDVCCTNIYINDGLGNFTLQPDSPLALTFNGSFDFSDVDGDGDQDIFLTGYDKFQEPVAKLYLNDGLANFTEIDNNPFLGVHFSSTAFGDIDGDDDPDLLITGANETSGPISVFYINDGLGNFTKMGNPFEGVFKSAIAFADIDGDNDQDILITGENGNFRATSKIYINKGQGRYAEKMGTSMPGVKDGAVAFADVDKDGDEDLLITGSRRVNNLPVATTRMYLNDGLGNFTEMTGTLFRNVSNSSIAFADIDGDDDEDVLITGSSGNRGSSRLYVNDGAGNFTEVENTPFVGVQSGTTLFADVDGDNDQDLIINGTEEYGHNDLFTVLYRNDGLGNFTEDTAESFSDVYLSSLAFADMDGDQDLDLLLTGARAYGNYVRGEVYYNQEEGFENVPEKAIPAVSKSSIAVSDVDGDSDMDVLVTGRQIIGSSTVHSISELYLNDGHGFLKVFPESTFEAVQNGAVAFSDVDGDGDEDLIITGQNDSLELITQLYFNLGNPSISGYCYYDSNENQTRDPSEPTLQNQIIRSSPNSSFSYPVFDGKYQIFVDEGLYQIAAIPVENWRLTTDSTVNVNFADASVSDLNFGFVPTAVIPLVAPDITSGPTRCSFEVPFWLSYQNNGTTFENGYVEFSITEGATLLEATVTPDEIIGNKMRWKFTNFAPSKEEGIRLILRMPNASNLGDTLDFSATTFLIDDNQDTTQNTVYTYNPVLNCAYDPNDKAALPAGVGEDNLTLFDSDFEYRIRFQNTGTDTAFTVRIEDDLDPNLNWKTFRPISASHPYEVDMNLETGRVTFLFRNILLPDSIVNEPLSHGFVKYKISPLSNLSEETPITNEASIFFDFNEPILTNRTLNTMVSVLTNTTEPRYSTELAVIPNPFQNSTIFRIKEIPGNRGTLNIYDTNGVLVFSQSVVSNTDVTFRKDDLASGIYFYEVVTQKGERVLGGKVIKY